ncbi:MBL fold metallo-hydrolase [Acetobacter sp. AN02]|uniref:MBL fold metallo-hydrolase n=1 Tax=Acetobacter sp. AN02 TaxID=2894186 RepID=UPI0024341D92|nr:MBL fold metallo-hydrolase [Acetobacter sp. AN02]MDG6095657.1 MBL fold metallo-hydrolase [Acetobacter sp. AN02]
MTETVRPEFEMLSVGPFRQHTSLIWMPDTKRGLLIDPGGESDHLLSLIGQRGLTIEAILLTHGHLDHAGGADEMRTRLTERQNGEHVPVIGPDRRDEFLLSGITEAAAQFGVTGLRNVKPDSFLTHGDVLELAGLTLNVKYVPGHTPGHVIFHCPAGNVMFAGDTLFRGTVGRTDFPYGDGPLLIRSIREQILPEDDRTIIIPGHGMPTTIGAEKAENPFIA